MSSTDRGRLAILRQSDCTAVPTTPTWQIMRAVSSALAYNKDTIESNELDASANPVGSVKVGAKSGGTISVEWSAQTYDDLLEAAFRGTFANAIDSTGAFVVVAAAATLTLASAFTNAAVGQWVLLNGFVAGESYSGAGDSPNNGWWEIATVTSANEVVLNDPYDRLVDETAAGTATAKSSRMLNGTRKLCHAIEEGFLDTASFLAFLGQYVNTLSFSLSAGQIMTGDIGFMGSDVDDEQVEIDATGAIQITAATRTVVLTGAFADAQVGQQVTLAGFVNDGNNVTGEIATNADDDTITLTAATTTLVDETGPATATVFGAGATWSAGATYTDATDDPALNATDNIGDILIAGDVSTSCFKSLQINLTNNLREVPCVGREFPRIEYGTPALTGSFEKLFVDLDLWRAMRDHDDITIRFGVVSNDGAHGIHFAIPAANINTDTVDLSGGKNSDVADKVDWTAKRYTNAASETYYAQVCVA